uniref:Venom protein n=1 Tax=Centruroides hentzi TaxID=88313 RepID=A0A2I9LPX5_9SCOR
MKSMFVLICLFVIILNFSQNQAQYVHSCREDEEYVNCISNCGPRRCSNILNVYPCTNLGPLCSPGCQCKGGKVYDNEGNCVHQTECFKDK